MKNWKFWINIIIGVAFEVCLVGLFGIIVLGSWFIFFNSPFNIWWLVGNLFITLACWEPIQISLKDNWLEKAFKYKNK